MTCADEALAQFRVTYQLDQRHLANVSELDRFDTLYLRPQLFMWELSDGEWLSVIRVPAYAPHRQRASSEDRQLALPFVTDRGVVRG